MNPLHRRLAAGMRAAAGGGGANDLLDSLVAYWPMASGAVVADVHGSFNLSANNLVGTGSAPTGNGNHFISNNSYLQRNDDGLNQGLSSFTVSIWVNLHGYNAGQYGSWIVNRRDASPGGDQRGAWQLVQSSTAYSLKFQYHYNANADNVAAEKSPRIETNRWYHLVGGLDATAKLISLYIDGVLVDSVSTPDIAPGQDNVMLRFGQWSWNSPDRKVNWDGEMADCGYWIGRAPDQAMVDALYNNGNGLTYDKFTQSGDPSLIHHWPMDEGAGTTFANIVDASNPINIVGGTGTWGTYDGRTAYRYNQDSFEPAQSASSVTLEVAQGFTIAIDVLRVNAVNYGRFVEIPTIIKFMGSKSNTAARITLPPGNNLTDYSFTAGNWMTAVIAVNASAAKLYRDGAYVNDVVAFNPGSMGTGGIITLGGLSGSNQTYQFNGCFRNLKIWNRTLNDAEIAAL